ncbi:MAG: hypothetical protein HZB14_08930 [Actinobacteria bacterium]|nr:hypothetical protein [Actinomycetota bacterium]
MSSALRHGEPIDLPLLAEAPLDAAAMSVCGLCGHRYAESAHSGCASCPMNDGCLMTCCPSCGYSAPDPRNSRLLAASRALAKTLRRLAGRTA